MFNIKKHKLVMIRILKDFYSDSNLGRLLGFKGGTMAYLFYNLPRESVDLDFDLLDKGKEKFVFDKVESIIEKHGKIIESVIKKNTIFFLLDYGFAERKIKIEITRKKTETDFKVMNYLGISMLTMNREAMVACKLLALATRKKMANRDIFDTWYFLKNGWNIDDKVIKSKSGLELDNILNMAIVRIEKIKNNEILFGLGDLLNNSMKDFVKNNLKKDVLLELNMRIN